MNISKKEIEHHRKGWGEIAKKNGWYTEPFHIQVWVNSRGEITNSLSFVGLNKDFVLHEDDDSEIIDVHLV
jgi:hypothetical protein